MITKHEHSQGFTSWNTLSSVTSFLASDVISAQLYPIEPSTPSVASKLLKKDADTLAETVVLMLFVFCASLDQVVPIFY